VTRRDIGSEPLPATVWRDAVTGGSVAEADRSAAQREARTRAARLADELIGADAVLLAIPLYNWGVASHVKSWDDVTYTYTDRASREARSRVGVNPALDPFTE